MNIPISINNKEVFMSGEEAKANFRRLNAHFGNKSVKIGIDVIEQKIEDSRYFEFKNKSVSNYGKRGQYER